MKRGREPEDDTANSELEDAQVRLIGMRIVCSSATPLAILQLNPSTVTSGNYTISPFSICHSRTLGAWAPKYFMSLGSSRNALLLMATDYFLSRGANLRNLRIQHKLDPAQHRRRSRRGQLKAYLLQTNSVKQPHNYSMMLRTPSEMA